MIPVNDTLIAKKAERYVLDCIRSGFVSSAGPYVERFEKAFAEYLGIKYALTTTNGLSALHLALASLRIGKGMEVLVPDLTIISTVLPVIYTGATPVFVEVEEKTGNINPLLIEKKITKRTRAIIPVHLYANPSAMDPIRKLAKKYNLFIIEDAAEALGSMYKGLRVGSIGDIGCFSLYANKLITTGEGGMLVTNQKNLYEKARSLRDLAHSPKKRFLHTELGFTYRMGGLQAALGLAQIEEIQSYTQKKLQIAKAYTKGLTGIPFLELPQDPPNTVTIPWMYALKVTKTSPISRDAVVTRLKQEGVDTRNFFIPMHEQTILKKMGFVNNNDTFPISTDLSKRGFYLPSGLALTDTQIIEVINCLRKIFKQ